MSGSINATATMTDVESSPGVFSYTVTVNDTGATTIGTFWLGWVPGQDYMTAPPTAIGSPSGWSSTVTTNPYPGGTGYAIEWTGDASASFLQAGGSSSAFTFTSTETPAQMAAASPFATSPPTTTAFVYEGAPLAPPGQQIVASVVASGSGLIGVLSANQQLELIYIAYFNRAADGGGFRYWANQDQLALNAGVDATTVLNGVANAFSPQPETVAIYPFLGLSNVDLSTPAGQTDLTNFVDGVYSNLFDRAADPAGAAYWVSQLTTGAVGLGAAALAIANGATGTDAIEVQNKIAVAADFESRTDAGGLGETSPLPASFITAAKSVLSGVDGASPDDASVIAGENATTAFLNGSATGQVTAATPNAGGSSPSSANDPITVSASQIVIDPGAGGNTITFLTGTSVDTLVLYASGVDQVSGFDPATDVLDLHALLSGANIDVGGNVAALASYLTVTAQGSDAVLNFIPTGQGGGSPIAVLHGLGSSVTSLDTLVAQHAIRIA